MKKTKTIALVAHDNRKQDLASWVRYNAGKLYGHDLVCTGTTGRMIEQVLDEDGHGLPPARLPKNIIKLRSGPLGGDQQLGAMIAEGRIDILIFFWDPMEPQPHDVDVKALLRISVLYNIPVGCNRSTADFLISSPLIDEDYDPQIKDYSGYLDREI
ncbi:MAG: methylglyoxal synthase [bacterium]|nr:methylglyoxal synthase [bacterium]